MEPSLERIDPAGTMRPYVVGLTGGSASGKSSFLRDLMALVPAEKVSIVSQDLYYLPHHMQQKDHMGILNFDLPQAFNRQSLETDLGKLIGGEDIEIEEYNFNNFDAEPRMLSIKSAPVIIVEGLFVQSFEEIDRELDLRLFIDAPEEIKLQRRLKRDIRERGYSQNEVMHKWHHHVKPAFEKWLVPVRDQADLIITNYHSYQIGLAVISGYLCQLLGEKSPVQAAVSVKTSR